MSGPATEWWDGDTRFAQAILRACQLYTGKIDGIEGPLTISAFSRFRELSEEIFKNEGPVEPVSSKRILRLQLKAQTAARRVMRVASTMLPAGIQVRISHGVRTLDEQARLYAKGRTEPGSIVTNAKPGSSWHNYGRAFDIALLRGSEFVSDTDLYKNVGHEVMKQVPKSSDYILVWGGEFRSFPDLPHYELAWPGSASQYGKLFMADTISPLLNL